MWPRAIYAVRYVAPNVRLTRFNFRYNCYSQMETRVRA